MFIFITVLIVAISLSMDTFSLSLSYGLFNISKRNILIISTFVGLFHFFMPIIGNVIGESLFSYIPVDENKLIGIIFLIISIDLLFSLFTDKELNPINNIIDILLFSFTVSIDSFATGTCIDVFKLNKYYVVFIFMIISFLFTYFGLSMGSILHDKLGRKSEIIGLVLLITLSIFYLVY